MTLVVEFYGGPGTGKSTTAASVFAKLKRADIHTELITEFAKEWAWQSRRIRVFDQLYVMATQMRRESRLLGKLDVIITDSPVRLANYYVHKYGTPHTKLASTGLVNAYEAEASNLGHHRLSVLLQRVKPYNPLGRFEDEAAAHTIDTELEEMLKPFGYHDFTADELGENKAAMEVLSYLDRIKKAKQA